MTHTSVLKLYLYSQATGWSISVKSWASKLDIAAPALFSRVALVVVEAKLGVLDSKNICEFLPSLGQEYVTTAEMPSPFASPSLATKKKS